MQLCTLDGLHLEGSGFQEPLSLLVLSFLALEGKKQRSELADLFWVHKPERKKRLRSLAQVIYRLQKEASELVQLEDDWLSTSIKTDANTFLEVLTKGDAEAALNLFKGHFLAGIERKRRLSFLGEEITEWIINTREKLYTDQLKARLELAEQRAFDEQFEEAAQIAWQGYFLGKSVSYPTPNLYEQLHLLLLAADALDDAQNLRNEAEDIYGVTTFSFCKEPFEARARLTHTATFRPRNPHLVNREKELATLLSWLGDKDKRLICLVGLAGVGKTELASEVARHARGQEFAKNGVHIAWLETLPQNTNKSNLLMAIAEALNIPRKTRDITIDNLKTAIGDSNKFLVLDNFEQLVEQYAGLIATLHEQCTNLRLLVTSREGLRLEHERPFSLKSLSCPTSNDLTLEEAGRFAAVKLFDLTAQKQDFTLSEDNLAGVIKICNLVEGLPLAVKLAAGWAHLLPPEQIAEELTDKLELLSQGTVDTDRHRSLEAALDYSLDLLDEKEKEALIKLAVFEGGWTLEAAQQVLSIDIRTLRSLIEKSLLRYDQAQGRYSLHLLIHHYLKAKLVTRQDLAALRDAHSTFYLNLLDGLIEAGGAVDSERLKVLAKEVENLEGAWRYAVEQGWYERLFQSSKALQTFGSYAARYRFVETLLRYAVEHCPPKEQALLVALSCNLGSIHFRLGDYTQAVTLTQQALESLPEAKIEPERELSILQLVYTTQLSCYSSLAKFDEALAVANEALKLFEAKKPRSTVYADVLVNLAILEKNILGESNLAYYDEALAIYEQKGQQIRMPWVLVNKGHQFILIKNFEEAETSLNYAEHLAKELGLEHWLAMSYYYQAVLEAAQNDFRCARSFCRKALDMAKRQEKGTLLATCFRLLANIAESMESTRSDARNFYDKALKYATQTNEIALANGIRIDQMKYLLLIGEDNLAAYLYSILQAEVARMYHRDKKKFYKVVASKPSGLIG